MLVGNTNNEGALYEMLGQPNVFSNTNSPGIGCLSHATAKARVDAGVKAWRYLYAAEFPNMDIGKTGAYHTADIGIWFGTTAFLSHKPDTEEEKKLISTIMPAWAGFAKDPENGLSKLGWPVYDGTKATVVRIGGKDSAEIKFEERGKFDRYGKVGEEKMC
jgi:cholinesterase